ncbi:hypothetical protein J4732_07925 [Serratia marcescens]|uniref:Uncharacterized protein n=1 Tax=Serratia marcescens TaxID=615 RepID=A0A939NRC0_SERMA|nr:hypothetical protein [Serratia marcescens]
MEVHSTSGALSNSFELTIGFRCYQLIKLENNAQSNAARYSFWGAAFAWTLIELQPCRLLAINPTQHD